jgi:hypothetical protein
MLVLYDFEAEEEGELTVTGGETVNMDAGDDGVFGNEDDTRDGWILVTNSQGETGYVPADFLEGDAASPQDDVQEPEAEADEFVVVDEPAPAGEQEEQYGAEQEEEFEPYSSRQRKSSKEVNNEAWLQQFKATEGWRERLAMMTLRSKELDHTRQQAEMSATQREDELKRNTQHNLEQVTNDSDAEELMWKDSMDRYQADIQRLQKQRTETEALWESELGGARDLLRDFMAGSLVAAADADGDGKVDAAELAEATGVTEEQAAATVAGADMDGDGKLDAAELAALDVAELAAAAEEAEEAEEEEAEGADVVPDLAGPGPSKHDDSSEGENSEDDDGSPSGGRAVRPSMIAFNITEDSFGGLDMEGWLHKKGTGKSLGGRRNWKRRFCRLTNDGERYYLQYATGPKPADVKGDQVVGGCEIEIVENKAHPSKFCFDIVQSNGEVATNFSLYADSQEDRELWVSMLSKAAAKVPQAK